MMYQCYICGEFFPHEELKKSKFGCLIKIEAETCKKCMVKFSGSFELVDLPNGPLRISMLNKLNMTYEQALILSSDKQGYIPNQSGQVH